MEPLYDQHGRLHDYLRVSLTERCNLRCTYCMPADGVDLTSKSHICSYEELIELIDIFISLGVRKVRVTGGEPLVRKEVEKVFDVLGRRPVELALTTNGLLVDRYIDTFESCGLKKINLSLDTLDPNKFMMITRRKGFDKVMKTLHQLVERDFKVKLNMVVMRNTNDNEIIDFARLTRHLPIDVRYIEFMPFDGNRWNDEKMVTAQEIRSKLQTYFYLARDSDDPNDTTRHYQIPGYQGKVGIISSMSEHFCGSCNRIRLLANGAIKNCLFSEEETDLLTPLRNGKDIVPLIRSSIYEKKAKHAGMFNLADRPNRTMTTIGG